MGEYAPDGGVGKGDERMLTFNRILLVSDFSASAEAALHYAAALTRQSHAHLLVLHVIDTRVAALPRWSDIFRSIEVFAALEAEETDAFKRLLAHPALADLPVEERIQHGNPMQCIIDLASDVDLVVMGAQGKDVGWGKAPGKVARHVAHGSPTPVLLVPEGGGSAGLPAIGANTLSMRRILLALHFAHYAPQAVGLSRAIATMCEATLQVLQVVEPDKVASYPLQAGAGLYHNLDAVKVLLAQRLAETVPDDPAGLPVERLVVTGNAAEVISQQSGALQADLVVMSVHAYGSLQKFFTSSTVDAVMEHVPCPLLAVPFPRASWPFTTSDNGFGTVD
jgi:nucleotide-binding universal stress UspA family protein